MDWSPWNSPGQNTRVGSRSLLQGIFPTQGSNLGLPHCRWILYQLSQQGSPLPSLRSKPDFLLTPPNMEHCSQHLAQNMNILKQSNVQKVPHVFLKLRVRVIISLVVYIKMLIYHYILYPHIAKIIQNTWARSSTVQSNIVNTPVWMFYHSSFLLFLSGIFSSFTLCQSVYTLELNFHLRFIFQETLTHFFTQWKH